MGGGGRHWVAYISKFTKRYVRLFQIFVHILSFFLTIYWRMKFRLTKASPYDVQLVKSIHQYFRFLGRAILVWSQMKCRLVSNFYIL